MVNCAIKLCKNYQSSSKTSKYISFHRTERGGVGEDVGAAVPDQQMRPGTPRYPVDRYLVESSKRLEMVNITDDDIWNPEPALRPEDEIILRKLHDMLQSTADDLKLLSGELSKYHEPGVQVKSLPTPLDEDFNEKVHIEELVNAKFHGYKIVDQAKPSTANTQTDVIDGIIKSISTNMQRPKGLVSTGVQVNQEPILKKPNRKNNLSITRTKVVQINENVPEKINNNIEDRQHKQLNPKIIMKPAVAYNEYSYEYVEPKLIEQQKPLQIQNMPYISIRSELKEQRVLNLDIVPEVIDSTNVENKNNIAVISIQHDAVETPKPVAASHQPQRQSSSLSMRYREPTRKVSKMSTCESSESTNNISYNDNRRIVLKKTVKTPRPVPKKSSVETTKHKKNIREKNVTTQSKQNTSIEEWKKKLNAVYGHPSSSRKNKTDHKVKNTAKPSSLSCDKFRKTENTLNNAEYIPYSKLTLGGVPVSDIEKELTDIPKINDKPLSSVLDKILSRENSFNNNSPRIDRHEDSPKILTTSDENLLQEVLDIEKKVSKTLSKTLPKQEYNSEDKNDKLSNDDNNDSYLDDFEEEKSSFNDDKQSTSDKQNDMSNDANNPEANSNQSSEEDEEHGENESHKSQTNNDIVQNRTFTKKSNLSFKNKVDIFEFVHAVDTQETGTQSNGTHKISLKGTQTSPRNDRANVQPIHNDLWPSIDPKGEVEKLFQLEKDFIKKLIIEEYGDILEKNINKPSTSKDNIEEGKNVAASQKNTQTSPAHVKSVMTSPTRMKTRTTSPFALSLTVDHQTSPMVIVEELQVSVENEDDLGISVNLSSPRFSLRLPHSSHDPSHPESRPQSKHKNKNENRDSKTINKFAVSSSSSVDGDYSSSELSSLGEIRLKLKRKLRKMRIPSISELSSTTSLSKYGSDSSDAVVPLRSEGELSLGQVNRKKSNKYISEGEMSLGRLN